MRTSRLVRHLGNVFLAACLLLLIYLATNEKDADSIASKSFEGRGGKISVVRQNIGDDLYDEDINFIQNPWDIDSSQQSYVPADFNSVNESEVEKFEVDEVVVVVVAQDEGSIVEYKNEFVETLEEPDKPDEVDVDDKDMLRENDVIEGNLVIDRSDDLIMTVSSLSKHAP